MSKSKGNRVPVTLRFNQKDIKLLTLIVQKEFKTNDLKLGLRTIILNTAQAYLDELSKQMKESKNADGNNRDTGDDSQEERNSQDSDS